MKTSAVLIAASACVVVAATAVAVNDIGAGTGTSAGSSAPAKPKVIVADGDNLLPSGTATDWVTYGDHLAVITVTGERALAAPAEEQAAGEGFISRVVSVHVDKLLWSRPGAPAAPTVMDWDLDGWTCQGDVKTPLRLDGEPLLPVGNTYVVPITYLSVTATVSAAGWSPLSVDSILPYGNETLGTGDTITGGYSGPASDPTRETAVRDDTWGEPASALVAELNATAPDPAAAAYMSQPPDVRYQSSRPTDDPTE